MILNGKCDLSKATIKVFAGPFRIDPLVWMGGLDPARDYAIKDIYDARQAGDLDR